MRHRPKFPVNSSPLNGGTCVGIVFWMVLLALATPVCAQKNTNDLRSVHGTVIGKSEDPLAGAVVYLENVHTMTVRTYISDSSGDYRFSGLDPNVDYQMHAEHDDLTSGNHTISSFDSRKDIIVSLKVDREKKKSEK